MLTQQEMFVQMLQMMVEQTGGTTSKKRGEMAPPVAPRLVHGPPTPGTPIPHGFTPTEGVVGAGIAGGGASVYVGQARNYGLEELELQTKLQ